MSVSAEVDERALREMYLPAFEHAVKTARPWTVMCAYNRINGVYASEHRQLLTDILRSEWGFDGFVVSDWAAVHDRPIAPWRPAPISRCRARDRAACARSSTRSTRASSTRWSSTRPRCASCASSRGPRPRRRAARSTPRRTTRLARRIAAEGMVLLKNDGVLPLSGGGRIAVVGRAAKEPRIQGGGSSQITPTQVDVPIDELARLAGDAAISYSDGYDDGAAERPDLVASRGRGRRRLGRRHRLRGDAGREGNGGRRSGRPGPRAAAGGVDPCGLRGATPDRRGPVQRFGRHAWRRGSTARPRSSRRGSRARPPVGRSRTSCSAWSNPSGRLAETFPLRLEDTPAYLDFPGDGDLVRYGEGLYIGYRWYEARDLPVAFPFGHGLSYTTFRYDDARDVGDDLRRRRRRDRHRRCHQHRAAVREARSSRSTCGMSRRRCSVPARSCGASRRCASSRARRGPWRSASIRARSPSGIHAGTRWVTEAGAFEILIGSSSAAIHAVVPVTVVAVGGDCRRR